MYRKILAAVLTVLLCLGTMAAPVQAATAEQDGLSIVLTTDRKDYSAKESITATLTVKNNGSTAVEDLVLESIVPEGYVLVEGEAKKAVDLLAPGFSMQLKVKLLPEGVQESAAPAPTTQPEEEKDDPDVPEAEEKPTETDVAEEPSAAPAPTEATAEQPETVQPADGDEQASEAVGKEETGAPDEKKSEEAMLVVSEKEEQRSFPWWLVIVLIVLAVAAIVIIALTHKKGAALVLCFVMVGSVLAAIAVPVQAAAMRENTIVVKEFVTVDGAQLILRATVSYKVENEDAAQSGGAQQPSVTPAPTPALSEAEKYVSENGEIKGIEDAATAEGLMSEDEALEEIADRGFEDFPVNYLHDTTGNRGDETPAEDGGEAKHPMYTTFYRANNGELWTIYVVNDCVMATPVGYNINQGTKATVVLSETGTIVTYDEETNRFIENTPDGTVCVVKKVDKITPQTLENMTKEELDKR